MVFCSVIGLLQNIKNDTVIHDVILMRHGFRSVEDAKEYCNSIAKSLKLRAEFVEDDDGDNPRP